VARWQGTLSDFVARAWLDFDSLFALAGHLAGDSAAGWRWAQAAWVSVAAGAGLAAWLARWAWRRRLEPGAPGDDAEGRAIWLACGLGAFFTVALSPLNQNNAYVLWAPLVLAALALPRLRAADRAVLGAAAAIMILAYSDLLPEAVRAALRAHAVKPLAPLLLVSLLLIRGASGENRRAA
jgi:hypothetical protein